MTIDNVRLPKLFRLMASLCALCGGWSAAASAGDWQLFENDYLIAYSSAEPEKAIAMMREMERFRSAALQVFAMRVPEDVPKTIVVIPGEWQQYIELGGSRYVGAYARRDGKRGVLVIPSKRLSEAQLRRIRHEYAHALLFQDGVAYPSWYNEGFAEFASSIEMSEVGDSFSIGRHVGRQIGYAGSVAVNWDNLIDDDFDPWSLQICGGVSAAYGQSWLLLHYALLGPNQGYRDGFPVYVAGLKSDLTSQESWHHAFGESPMELWQGDMRDYSSRLPYHELHFRGVTLDEDFEQRPAPEEELASVLRFLKIPIEADGQKRVKKLPRAHYEGPWSKVSVSAECSDPIQIQYADDTQNFTIQWEKNLYTDEYPDPAVYTVKKRQGGNLQLDKVGGHQGEDRWVRSFVMSYRDTGIMCMSRTDARPNHCDIPYVRCGDQVASTVRDQ